MLALFRKPTEDVSFRSRIDLSLPIESASYVVMDTELTGLEYRADSIVSVGAMKMTGSRIELNRTFYEVVRPRTELTSKSIVVHEITPSETAMRPGIEVKDDLRVGPGREDVAGGDELPPEVEVVVDLAVQDDALRAVLVEDRLMPAR